MDFGVFHTKARALDPAVCSCIPRASLPTCLCSEGREEEAGPSTSCPEPVQVGKASRSSKGSGCGSPRGREGGTGACWSPRVPWDQAGAFLQAWREKGKEAGSPEQLLGELCVGSEQLERGGEEFYPITSPHPHQLLRGVLGEGAQGEQRGEPGVCNPWDGNTACRAACHVGVI